MADPHWVKLQHALAKCVTCNSSLPKGTTVWWIPGGDVQCRRCEGKVEEEKDDYVEFYAVLTHDEADLLMQLVAKNVETEQFWFDITHGLANKLNLAKDLKVALEEGMNLG